MISPTSKPTDPVRATPGARGRARGFTLLELLLAIGLLGLVLGMSLPRVAAVRDGFRHGEDVRAVAVFLRTARDLAVTSRTTTAVSIAGDDPRSIELRYHGGPGTRTTEVLRRVTIADRIEFVGERDAILFFADARSAGGELVIRDDSGSVRHRVRVEAGPAHVLVDSGGGRR